MELKVIKKNKFSVPNYSKKFNVAAYIRVSTEQENQIFSFESQIKYYSNIISKNVNWNFVDIYADYGVSGTQVSKRKEFQRMVNDALKGKIDLILTKSISRFARNAENLLTFVRLLRNHNVAVYFEEEKIYTLNMESEFLLSILASVAEQESVNTSQHIKLGVQARMIAGTLVCGKKRYGYDIVDGNFVINKKEAKVIRSIFEMYVSGYKSGEIAEILNKKKVPTAGGAKWSNGRIRDYIKNEIYVGDLLQGKKQNIRVNGHIKQVTNKDGGKYLIENHHEPIVSRELYEEANRLLKSRAFSNEKYNSLFPEKIYCGFCGSSAVVQKVTRVTKCYNCCNRVKTKCKSIPVREDLIINAFQNSIKRLIRVNNRENVFVDYKNCIQKKVSIDNKIDSIYKKQLKLAEEYMNKKINTGKYKFQLNNFDKELENLKYKQDKIISELNKYKEINESIKKLYSIIDNNFNKDKFDITFFNKIVHLILIGGESEKGTVMPYMIRFIYSDKNRLFEESSRLLGKNYLKHNDKTITILDFRNNFSFPIKQHKNKTNIKGTRVKFEIER